MSVPFYPIPNPYTHDPRFLQEDEGEMAQRKMKEEDLEVDIEADSSEDGRMDVIAEPRDEDMIWADDDPDQDLSALHMKVLIQDGNDSV